MVSLLIRHAHVLDLDLPFERADVLIDDSRIVQVAPTLLGGADLFLRPKQLMINSLVLGELGGSVETVLVAGDVVLENGRSTRVDEDSLAQEVQSIVQASLQHVTTRQNFLDERWHYVERLLSAVEARHDGPPGVIVPGQPILATDANEPQAVLG